VSLGQDGMAIIIQYRANHELTVDTIQVKHFPLLKFKMMPACLGNVLELVRMGVHTPCCYFMQQRLPQVGSRAINQNNLSLTLLAKLITKTSDQLKTTGAPTHHDDAMRPSRWRRFKCWSGMGHSFHEKSIEAPHERIHAQVMIFTKPIFYL
jgi:hypothetical protein